VVFVPITVLIVLPVLDRVLIPSTDNSELYAIASQTSGMLTVIIAGSVVFHALYGLVYGTMMTLLIPYKSRDLMNIT
jgi:hypothetical protein